MKPAYCSVIIKISVTIEATFTVECNDPKLWEIIASLDSIALFIWNTGKGQWRKKLNPPSIFYLC